MEESFGGACKRNPMEKYTSKTRYKLDATNVKAFLVMLDVPKGFVGRVSIDVPARSPFYLPEECPGRCEAIFEAIKRLISLKFTKVNVTSTGQVITINSDFKKEDKPYTGDGKDLETDDFDEKYDEWDPYGESLEDYVCRIVGDDSYHLEVYTENYSN